MVQHTRSEALLLISLFPNRSPECRCATSRRSTFPPSAMRVRWLQTLAQFSLNIRERAVRKASPDYWPDEARALKKPGPTGLSRRSAAASAMDWSEAAKAQARRCGAHPEGFARPPCRA